ncbi:MAG: DUF4349 domain-containing protein [Chloroflexi bacterium]|nr:DUF4349 domain-containing protein [Chloroflexota bacterium]
MLKKRLFVSIIALFLFSILLFACASRGDSASGPYSNLNLASEPSASSSVDYYDAPADEDGFAGEAEEEMAFDSDDAGFAANMDTSSAIPASEPAQQEDVTFPQERLIIRNAELSLVVANTDEAIFKITEMVESDGGWVVNSNVYQYDEDAKTGSITVRIPSSGFTSALEAMKGLAVRVTNESTSGQDVTDEYVDLSLQLENLEATADRVRSFLDDAQDVEDALAVNMELSRLEGDIERIKGRVQFLSQSASFSTITVNLTPDVLSQPIEVAGWQPQGIAREAIEALINGLQATASFFIWVGIYVLPLGLLYGVPTFFIVRFIWRRWRRRGQTAPVSEA